VNEQVAEEIMTAQIIMQITLNNDRKTPQINHIVISATPAK